MGSNRVAAVVARPKKMFFLFLTPLIFSSSIEARHPKTGIFSVVKFANEACASSTAAQNGTCLTTDECSSVGGTASGTCAEGFGVCCVLALSCGGTSSTNNTYLTQSSTSTSQTCSYTVCPSGSDVCALRIDFEEFEMTAASTTASTATQLTKGNCDRDTLTISNPAGANPPLLCGTLTGQHLYVDASSACHKVDAIISSTDTSTSRKWNIKVTQIECTNTLLPPAGCLQYYTRTTGFLYNFGWRAATTLNGAPSTTHMNNHDYTMCIRREEGYCSMQYSATMGALGTGANPPAATFGDVACLTDYVTIPGLQVVINAATINTAATDLVTVIGDRVSGDDWTDGPNPATNANTYVTFMKPFRVGVHFDATELATEVNNNGFAIYYSQQRCV